MDGASKFVRGDAIAGIIITLINIGAGFVIGVLQNGMPMAEAAKVHHADRRRRPGGADPGAAAGNRRGVHGHPHLDRQRHG